MPKFGHVFLINVQGVLQTCFMISISEVHELSQRTDVKRSYHDAKKHHRNTICYLAVSDPEQLMSWTA